MTELSRAGKKWMNFQIQADPKSEVFVAGTFNGWNPKKNKLTFNNGVYSTTIALSKGRHEYKFVINDLWCIDPKNQEWVPNGHGSLNSVLTVQ